jgi:2-dehydro-3-deoxygluconokinase
LIELSPEIISMGEPMAEFCATSEGRLQQVTLFKRGWGGDTSNFAVAVARLGGEAGYLCRIGDDGFGKSFMDLWKNEGVDASRVVVEGNSFTAVYFISLLDGGGHEFTYYRAGSAASHYSPGNLDEAYVGGARVLHSSGISLAVSQSLREAVFKAASVCKGAGGLFSFDPNVRPKLWPIGTARAVTERAFRMADIVLASIEDMDLLYGIRDPIEAAMKLRDMGVEAVVVKLGGDGCYVSKGDESFRAPGFKVDVLDTTGSGDAFDGAFVLGLLEGWGLRDTADFANAVGALTATGHGAVAPIPNRAEAFRLMKSKK